MACPWVLSVKGAWPGLTQQKIAHKENCSKPLWLTAIACNLHAGFCLCTNAHLQAVISFYGRFLRHNNKPAENAWWRLRVWVHAWYLIIFNLELGLGLVFSDVFHEIALDLYYTYMNSSRIIALVHCMNTIGHILLQRWNLGPNVLWIWIAHRQFYIIPV